MDKPIKCLTIPLLSVIIIVSGIVTIFLLASYITCGLVWQVCLATVESYVELFKEKK